MKILHFHCLVIALLLSFSLPLAAQKFLPKTIQFKGDPEYTNAELLAAIGLKPGISITGDQIKESAKLLTDSGAFSEMTFKFDGVDLVYTLAPSQTVYPIHLDNLPLTAGPELDNKLHQRFPLYHGKVPPQGALLNQVRGALEEMLAAEGIKATIAAAPMGKPGTTLVAAINFSIIAPKVQVGEIQLQGVSPSLRAPVQALAASIMKTPYDSDRSVADLVHAFEAFYIELGYANVQVHAALSGAPVVTADSIQVPFSVAINQGKYYEVGAVYMPSGEKITEEAMNVAAGITPDNATEKLTIKGGVTLQNAMQFADGQYKSKGYMETVLTPRAQFDEAHGIVNYKLEVQTGPVYKMGKLTIEDVADDVRAKMLANWKMPEGAVFNEREVFNFYYKQRNVPLALIFATTACKYKLAQNADTRTVDVTLRLEKRP
jgi:outer membrane protein assembly factor BamA